MSVPLLALRAAVAALAAFLLGALPWGLWIGLRVRGIDVRQHGSGNLGATNVYRTLGPALGWTVFALDVAKGVAGVLAAAWIADGALPGGRATWAAVGALAAVLGHVFTPFAGWKGGKGVATTLGAVFALAPFASALCLGMFLLMLALSRRISVGSIVGILLLPVLLWAVPATRAGTPAALVGSALAVIVVVRHVPNIRRLMAGTEPTFSLRKPPPATPGAPGTGAGA